MNKGGGGVERGGGGACLERSSSPGEQFNTGESDTVTNATQRELLVRLLPCFIAATCATHTFTHEQQVIQYDAHAH